ncbi:hypothetical protein [Aurantibacter sp.]|uniref:hypothetical protein n=1 Tax=Aurantibacter sp. TaxID=2807103 RepID=UPI0035C7B89C
MDELELLKGHWKQTKNKHKTFSTKDLTSMLHKKSSSIVKTLFYISIAELAFWVLLNFIPFVSPDYEAKIRAAFGSEAVYTAISIFTFGIVFLFIYLLYKSYRNISTTDSTKVLMQNILKTRKIVKCYVIYNLAAILLTIPFSLSFSIKNNPQLSSSIESFSHIQLITSILTVVFIVAVVLGFFWLFYKLLYGILLKQLNHNYKELKKLEV